MMAARLLIILAIFSLSACSGPASDKAHVHHTQFFAFGTVIEISQYDDDEERVKRAEELAKKDFEYMHDAWQPYEAGPTARINSLLPLGAEFSAAPSVLPLIKKGGELEAASDGFFNPAIGELIKLWGFDRAEDMDKLQPPDDSKIQEWLANSPSMADIKVDVVRVISRNPHVLLDFGGFAKGYGIDRVIEAFAELGVKNAIVNAGGDLRAIGSKGGKPWVIGIRHPRNNGVLASLEISGDQSVFTSGDYERYFEYDGRRFHHILNPKTGYPASDFQSVTIVHDNATLADAAATAVFVAGKKDWKRVAKNMGITQVMLVDQEGKISVTTELEKRIRFQNVDPAKIETVDL